jgi:hypothetical protein
MWNGKCIPLFQKKAVKERDIRKSRDKFKTNSKMASLSTSIFILNINERISTTKRQRF